MYKINFILKGSIWPIKIRDTKIKKFIAIAAKTGKSRISVMISATKILLYI